MSHLPVPSIVRIPDISLISWDRFPNRKIPKKTYPGPLSRSGRGSPPSKEHQSGDRSQAPRTLSQRHTVGKAKASTAAICCRD